MKALFLFFSFFTISNAIACPNFTGTYACPNEQGGVFLEEISQRVENNKTIYTIKSSEGSEEIYADGRWRTYNIPELKFGQYMASCIQSSLIFNIQGTINAKHFMSVSKITLISNNLYSETQAIYDGKSLPLEKETCIRQN